MYVVKFDDGREQTARYFKKKEIALYKFNKLLSECKLVNLNGNKIPCRVEDDGQRRSIEKTSFDDLDVIKEQILENDLLLKQQTQGQ